MLMLLCVIAVWLNFRWMDWKSKWCYIMWQKAARKARPLPELDRSPPRSPADTKHTPHPPNTPRSSTEHTPGRTGQHASRDGRAPSRTGQSPSPGPSRKPDQTADW